MIRPFGSCPRCASRCSRCSGLGLDPALVLVLGGPVLRGGGARVLHHLCWASLLYHATSRAVAWADTESPSLDMPPVGSADGCLESFGTLLAGFRRRRCCLGLRRGFGRGCGDSCQLQVSHPRSDWCLGRRRVGAELHDVCYPPRTLSERQSPSGRASHRSHEHGSFLGLLLFERMATATTSSICCVL